MDKEEELNNQENEDLEEEENSSLSNEEDEPRTIEDVKAKGSKELLKILLKHPMTWIVVGIFAFAIIIVVLQVTIDFDLFGVGDPKVEYKNTNCSNVRLTWERVEWRSKHPKEPIITDPTIVDLDEEDEENVKRWEYEEIDYTTYVTNVVYNDNEAAGVVDNEIMYQAMGVAARSFLVASMGDNCVVLKDYNPQNYTKLNGDEENYSTIKSAVTNSNDMIIGRNKEIIKALYDPFSYTYKREEGTEEDHFYHMMNYNNEEHQKVPAKWVFEHKNIPITKVDNETKMSSMSLYGGKYLQEHKDFKYTLYRILEYYYGRDIEYYTIDANYKAGNGTIPQIPIVGPITNGCYYWPIGSNETTTENGIELATGSPSSTSISSYFGPRSDPFTGKTAGHGALDIPATRGVANVIASDGGTITSVFTGCVEGNKSCGGGYGNHVVLDHGNGVSTLYAHMDSVKVANGDVVKKGQVLGKVGSTGRSTGPHLHFEVRDHGTKVDPLNYVSTEDPRATKCSPVGPIIPTGNEKQMVCAAFTNNGYTPAQVAGVMVNVNSETAGTWNPNICNGGSLGDCGRAYGLFQWLGGRKNNLKALKNWDSAAVQIAFALSELSTTEKNAHNQLIKTNTPNDASYTFCMTFERPGEQYCVPRRNTNLNETYFQYAKNGCQ